MKCPYCNGEIEVKARFCPYCGRKFTADELDLIEHKVKGTYRMEIRRDYAQDFEHRIAAADTLYAGGWYQRAQADYRKLSGEYADKAAPWWGLLKATTQGWQTDAFETEESYRNLVNLRNTALRSADTREENAQNMLEWGTYICRCAREAFGRTAYTDEIRKENEAIWRQITENEDAQVCGALEPAYRQYAEAFAGVDARDAGAVRTQSAVTAGGIVLALAAAALAFFSNGDKILFARMMNAGALGQLASLVLHNVGAVIVRAVDVRRMEGRKQGAFETVARVNMIAHGLLAVMSIVGGFGAYPESSFFGRILTGVLFAAVAVGAAALSSFVNRKILGQ